MQSTSPPRRLESAHWNFRQVQPQVSAAVAYGRTQASQQRWLEELSEFLSFPTVSSEPEHGPDIAAAARWLARHVRKLGLEHVTVLSGPEGSAPSVYADWLHAPGKPTVLLYGHFDVQPPGPLGPWRSPPFRPTRRGRSLFSRGASDDKGQMFAHLKALESYLRAAERLPLNVKLWLEGEEEISSPSLPAFLDREVERLRADAVLVSDTEMPAPDRPAIIYGLRGHVVCEIEVRGASHDVHSGRFGGTIHNPLQALCELIAGLHDRDGRVTVADFYRRVRPLEESERTLLQGQATYDRRLLAGLELPGVWGERGYTPTERMVARPALAVLGIRGGEVGPRAGAAIPSSARALLGFRLVPDQDPDEIGVLIQRHIAAQTPQSVRTTVHIGRRAGPVLLPRQDPAIAAAARAAQTVWGAAPLFSRNGGTIAVVEQLHRRLRAPVVVLGFGLPDDHIHGPNEKLDLPTFFRGVETVVRFLAEYAR
jgi:acetylornithine deacetylase/succinyl-diaminopimelate desuccinylase-like protein